LTSKMSRRIDEVFGWVMFFLILLLPWGGFVVYMTYIAYPAMMTLTPWGFFHLIVSLFMLGFAIAWTAWLIREAFFT